MVKLLGIAWTRIRTNMRDPLIRRNVAFFMGGTLIGLALVLVAMWVFLPSVVHAMNRGASVDMPTINAVNTVWTLVAAFLVFCMQVGFVMLEADSRVRANLSIFWWKALLTPASAVSCFGPGGSPSCSSQARP